MVGIPTKLNCMGPPVFSVDFFVKKYDAVEVLRFNAEMWKSSGYAPLELADGDKFGLFFWNSEVTCARVKSRVLLGMGDLPPLIGILIIGI